MTRFRVKRLTETAKMPERANPTDAGMDVYSDVDCEIRPGDVVRVSTGIAVHPEADGGGYGKTWTLATLVWDKSSLGSKGLKVMGGVIDDPYRGEVFVVLANVNTSWVGEALRFLSECGWDTGMLQGVKKFLAPGVAISREMKIANLIVQRVELPVIEDCEHLGDTARGAGGFGSTGIS